MKIQILPNWCKKLGLFLFIIGTFISGVDDFIDGLRGLPGIKNNEGSNLIKMFFSEPSLHLFNIIGIIGVLIYMLSKEKIEDDYINQLRLESFQLTAIIGILLSILLYSFSKDINLTLDYYTILFMWFYLITFFIKKNID